MKKWFLFLGISVSFLVFSCSTEITGGGAIVTQTYTPIANFTGVSTDHSIDVTVVNGNAKTVKVTGYENLMEHIKISVSGGVVKIGMDPDYQYENMNLTATVTVPQITKLIVAGTGNINLDTFPTISSLYMGIEGSGNISSTTPFINNLTAVIYNSGNINLSGKAIDQNITIAGTGSVNAFDLNCSNSEITITGEGHAEVKIKGSLTAVIEGSGNIYYKGSPSIDSTITGTGNLIDAN